MLLRDAGKRQDQRCEVSERCKVRDKKGMLRRDVGKRREERRVKGERGKVEDQKGKLLRYAERMQKTGRDEMKGV